MARRGKKKSSGADPEKPVAAAPANRPFAGLAGIKPVEPKPKAPPPPPPEPDDDELFAKAVADVRPIPREKRERVRKPPSEAPSTAPNYDEDAEALAKLAAMVEGTEPLGSEFSEEHAEWIDDDADPGILPRLVAGEFAWQEHLDLHGMTREQAHAAIIRFLAQARVKHLRCVLLVHGRGNHSEGSIPVLKLALQRWLQRAPIKGWVFAWATARPVDGGAGAMYVLLRD